MKIRFKRAIAALIDYYLICFIATYSVSIVTLGKMNVSVLSVTIFFVAYFLAILLKDILFGGASIGKRIFKIKVVNADGTKVSFVSALKRTVTMVLLPVEIAMLFATNRRLGDRWAKTSVVSKTNTDDCSINTGNQETVL